MIQRCTNPQRASFADYGGRGIKVCDRWLSSFSDFLADVGARPSADHQIDRKENNGNYEPGNVRWVTRVTQMRNKRSNRKLTWRGETASLAEWGERLGVPAHVFQKRLNRGWDDARTLSTPHCKSRGPAVVVLNG